MCNPNQCHIIQILVIPAINTSHYHSHVSSPYGPNYMPPWTSGANTPHAYIQPAINPYPISGSDQYYREQIPLLPRSQDIAISRPPSPPSPPSSLDLSSDTDSDTMRLRKGAKRTPKQPAARSHASSSDSPRQSHVRQTEINGSTSLDTKSDRVIHYINALGEKFEFPLSKCVSWEVYSTSFHSSFKLLVD